MGSYQSYRTLNRERNAPNSRDEFSMIEGDRVAVLCRKHGDWKLIHASGQHRASHAILSKNVLAIVLAAYTNVQA